MSANLMSSAAARRTIRPASPRVTRVADKEMDLVVQLAHDIRSPLSGILILAESLQNGLSGPVTDSQRRQLELIHGAALSLCTSASDVVELALDGQGLDDESPDVFSITRVLNAVSAMASPLAAGKNLELRIAHPVRDRRRGCARALTRVLLNLTTNALKCTETGVVEITAREVAGNSDRLVFSVRDSGPGLQTAVLRAIEKVPRHPAEHSSCTTSSGLGLAICRRLMQQMGTTLQFETSPQSGTRFFFDVVAPCV